MFFALMAQIWRISANGKPVIQRCFKRLLKKNDGAKITFSRLSKKMLSLQQQTITYEPVFYIFHFAPTPPPCGVLHLLRQRTRLRNRPKLLWLTVLQQRPEHLVERGPDE